MIVTKENVTDKEAKIMPLRHWKSSLLVGCGICLQFCSPLPSVDTVLFC
jgi:hypothetical protein